MDISYSKFMEMDIRIGQIKECDEVPKSRNLLKCMIDCGEKDLRQVVAGMSQHYKPDEMIGRKVVVLVNLEPRKLMGIESQGMILAADVADRPYLLVLEDDKKDLVPPGSKIK